MRYIIAIVVLMLLATGSTSAAEAPVCQLPGKGIRVFGPALTVSQLERIGIAFAARNPAQPQVKFSRGNRSWLALKGAARPSDVVRSYDGPRGHDGNPISGGYILMRDTCVVARLTLWVA